ncbi:MAG: hypothetical protein M1834_005341 [Cirrosporium novae-zelandiae]|nr:MAG: hypothetical protein M1834_005341 [Cirrosporium novae-zelandiae]
MAGSLVHWFQLNFQVLQEKAKFGQLTATSHEPAKALDQVPKAPRIQLRGYQEECIQAVLSNIQQGHKRLGISLATGSGKTVIFTQLIGRLPPLNQHASQSLILVHRRELVEQAARHCVNNYPSKTVEIEMGDSHASGLADITIASIQSIVSGDRIEKFDPKRFKLVLVDEAHHIVARTYLDTLEHFGLMKPEEHSPTLVGVSATMSRFDGLRLGAVIDRIVYHKDYIDMIGEKWLSDVIFTTVESKMDLRKVKNGANGDFATGELSNKVNTLYMNDLIIRTWLAKAENRKSTLVFCVDLRHLSALTNAFRDKGIDARYITGNTKKNIRGERLDAFRNGEFPVLLNCGVFTEGTDIPNIDCVLLARPTKSRNLLVQMIGRGMRLHPTKDNCHVIDFVTSLQVGVVSAPSLFGLDPSELIDEATVNDMKEIKDRKEEEDRREESTAAIFTEYDSSSSMNRKVIFTDYDSVLDLIDDTSYERYIRSISRLAWVQVDDFRYVLTARNGDYMVIEKDGALFSVCHTIKLPPTSKSKSPYGRAREIATAEDFIDAVHAADTFALDRFDIIMIGHNQKWRKKPASEGQLKFLNKFRPADMQLSEDDITKGKAGDMITKLKFGAKGRFARMQTSKRKEDREQHRRDQLDELRRREEVKLGPLES